MASFLAEMPQSMNCSLLQTCLFVRWRIHPMYYKRELLKRRRHIYRVTNRGHDLFFFPPRKSQCSNPANIQATLSHLSTKTTCVQKRTTFLSFLCLRSFFLEKDEHENKCLTNKQTPYFSFKKVLHRRIKWNNASALLWENTCVVTKWINVEHRTALQNF